MKLVPFCGIRLNFEKLPVARVPLLCFYHILTSFVIYQTHGNMESICFTDTWMKSRVFLCVAETIVASFSCCSVGIVQCLFNLCIASFGDRTRPQNQETDNYKNKDVFLR